MRDGPNKVPVLWENRQRHGWLGRSCSPPSNRNGRILNDLGGEGIEVCCLFGEYVAAEVRNRLAGLDERRI